MGIISSKFQNGIKNQKFIIQESIRNISRVSLLYKVYNTRIHT